MLKHFTIFLVSLFFLFPHHLTLANEKNIYYNEEYKYIVSFPDNWFIFSQEMKENLTPDEIENSPAIFINSTGSSQMFIRHLGPGDKKFNLYKKTMDYVQKIPDEKQKIKRVLNPISTELGRTINEHKIDELNETIELQLTQSSNQFGEIYTTIFWKEFKGTLIEIEFFHFEKDVRLFSEASEINNSFTITADNFSSNMEEGSLELFNTKVLSGEIQEKNIFNEIINFIEKPIVWISVSVILFLLFTLRIVYKYI